MPASSGVPGPGLTRIASGAEAASSSWQLRVDGADASRDDALGWANAFDLPRGGTATLTFDRPLSRWLFLVVQAGLWLFVISRVRRPTGARPRSEAPS